MKKYKESLMGVSSTKNTSLTQFQHSLFSVFNGESWPMFWIETFLSLNLAMTILGRVVINEGVKENGILAIGDNKDEEYQIQE